MQTAGSPGRPAISAPQPSELWIWARLHPNESSDAADHSGAAYVFVRNGETWTQQAYVKASNTDPNDNFGTHVAISGELMAVSAPFEKSNATGVDGDESDNSADFAGAAYVFSRSGTVWAQEAYLKASNTSGGGDFFGGAIALSGDTLAVGAAFEASAATGVNGDQLDNSAPGAGAVYIFKRSGTSWSQTAYLKASNTDRNDAFGAEPSGFLSRAIALDGDILVVGAEGEDSAAAGLDGNQSDNSVSGAGAVYIFGRALDGTWSQHRYAKASNTGGDKFGYAVATSNGTVAVGAVSEASSATGVDGNESDDGTFKAGAAYVIE